MAFLVKLRALRSLTAQAAAAEDSSPDDSALLFSTKHLGSKASPRASECSHMAAMGSKRSTASSSPSVSEGGVTVDKGSSSPVGQCQQEEHGQDDSTVAQPVAGPGPASDAVAQHTRCALAEEPLLSEAAAQAPTGC